MCTFVVHLGYMVKTKVTNSRLQVLLEPATALLDSIYITICTKFNLIVLARYNQVLALEELVHSCLFVTRVECIEYLL